MLFRAKVQESSVEDSWIEEALQNRGATDAGRINENAPKTGSAIVVACSLADFQPLRAAEANVVGVLGQAISTESATVCVLRETTPRESYARGFCAFSSSAAATTSVCTRRD